MKRTLSKRIILITILILVLFLIFNILRNKSSVNTQLESATSPTEFSGFYFDTYISIIIYDECHDDIINGLKDLCDHYDTLFSPDNTDSDIYSFNNSTNGCVVNEETLYLTELSLDFAKSTEGIIDPTIYSVSKLWDFENISPSIPSIEDINSQLNYVDYNTINIDNSSNYIEKNKGQMISFGFIAKGYIADQIKDFLVENNIHNALINLGGNVACIGTPSGKDHYTVAIQYPFEPDRMYCTLNINDKSVVTSGIYERSFTLDNTIYHHILDTSTGMPADNDIYSVTVIGDSSTICDALSTTLFLLGKEKGMKYLEDNYPDYSCLYILNDYSYIASENMEPINLQ